MISCDEGKTAVVGMGYKVLSEWATLTYSILMEFKENNIDKEFKEHLKEKMRGALEMDFAMAFGEKTREEIMREVMEKKRGETSLS